MVIKFGRQRYRAYLSSTAEPPRRTPLGPMLLSIEERYPLYGDVIFRHAVFWDEDICSLFRDVCCIEVSLNRQNRLKFVYTHFKSCGQSLDKNFLISPTNFMPRKVVL